MFRLCGLLLVVALVTTACGDDADDADDAGTTAGDADTTTASPTTSDAATTTTAEAATTTTAAAGAAVTLVDYPLWDTPVLVADQALLDELAADYVATTDQPEVERFLFGYAPVVAFDRLLTEDLDPDTARGLLWVLHLSGYFGGRWLRGEIATAQPDAPLVGFSNPPTEESFLATMERAQTALDAAVAEDDEAVAYADASLWDETDEVTGEPIRGLADNFGYNQGYMLEILETPPAGLAASPEYQITCAGPLACDYASPRLPALAGVADVQAALVAGTEPAYVDLGARILPVQDAAVPRGRAVWSSGLSVQGFPQQEYDQLLDVSSTYLETVQATALTMVRAIVDGDAGSARLGAAANAGMIVWLGGYYAGLTNGEDDVVLPDLATS